MRLTASCLLLSRDEQVNSAEGTEHKKKHSDITSQVISQTTARAILDTDPRIFNFPVRTAQEFKSCSLVTHRYYQDVSFSISNPS